MFVAHADWGVDSRKRWVAVARQRDAGGWEAAMPAPVGEYGPLRERLGAPEGVDVVAGFDFPIGLPRAYAARVGVERFVEALPALDDEFFIVADAPEEISLARPFFPRTATTKGAKTQAQLTGALGLSMDDLRRRCERAQPHRRAACPLFWTCGGNQVGKGALSGWRLFQHEPDVAYWPFDGTLEQLRGRRLVVAEAYPAEFYGHLGMPAVVRKRTQAGRAAQADPLLTMAATLDVRLPPGLVALARDGFGPRPDGEDAFDAVVGLLGMINVVAGNRPTGEPLDDPAVQSVEGWILGQLSSERA